MLPVLIGMTDDIEAAAADLILPVGRLQRINPQKRPAVYVDFAHTPDALSALWNLCRGLDDSWFLVVAASAIPTSVLKWENWRRVWRILLL